MSKRTKWILAIVAAIFVVAQAVWSLQQPKVLADRFATLMADGKYGTAGDMLWPPCAIELVEGGGVILVDENGDKHGIPPSSLPFAMKGEPEWGVFKMVGKVAAPEEGEKGAKQPQDAIVLRLSADGGKIRIEKVDR